MLSVSRPIEVVVLNDWVTLTKVTPCPVEDLDQLREVHQRARQPVDLVDHDDVDQPLLDVGDQLLQRRAAPACRRRSRRRRRASRISAQPSDRWLAM